MLPTHPNLIQPTPPINRLPREVLGTIFLLASPRAPYRPPNLAHLPTAHTPTLIAHVCRSWRSVAFSTPRLWTDIRVTPQLSERALLGPLARCSPHTYSLSVRASTGSLGWINTTLPPYLGRCHALRLTGQIEHHPPVKLSLFPGQVHIRAIEFVHVELPSMRQLIDILELCPMLTHLTLRDLHMDSDAPGSVRQRRKLRSLRKLAMQVDENFDIIQGFFPRVVTPNLESLELAYGPEGPHVVGPFIIYDDCMASVTELIMRGEVLATDFVLSMMQKAGPLRRLELWGCGVTDEFLQGLERREMGGGWIAPGLEGMLLRGCDYVSGGGLVRLVKERRAARDKGERVKRDEGWMEVDPGGGGGGEHVSGQGGDRC